MIKMQSYLLIIMDRTKSVNLIIQQNDICPWKSQEEDFDSNNIDKQEVKLNLNIDSEKVLTQEIKQARSEKFYKILQQHRERLMRKKLHRNTQSVQNEQRIKNQKKLSSIGVNQYEKMHIIELKKKSYTVMSRLAQQDKLQNKCLNPKLINIYEYEKQARQLFHRPKTTNKNADKFYGNMSKKDSINLKYSSNIDLHKIYPIAGKVEKKEQKNIIKFRKVVELKLIGYRSSKSVQKLRQRIEQKKRKQKNDSKIEKQRSKVEEEHVLDRILINR